uniref:Synaptogyrin 3 n=1 Tax=Schistosoma japonicum TaxID=6182 RepID=C7TYZ4_SCHJA|nr:synaptogyrin 3 [Schistosoma japonicum]
MLPVDWMYKTALLEPVHYIQKPQVLLRLVTVVLSVVLIAIVHNGCYIYGKCLFSEDQASCGYSLFLSSSSVILCLFYLWFDLITDNISNIVMRTRIVKLDVILTGIWAFLWLIAFCLLCNRWKNTDQDFLSQNIVSPDGPRAAVAVTFFGMIILIILGFFTFKSYKSTEIQCSNFTYGETDNLPGYHDFAGDSDMLDASDPDAPTGYSNTDYKVGDFRSGLGGVHVGDAIGSYQP